MSQTVQARHPPTHPPLRETVEKSLTERHSPEQIAGRLRLDFPDDPQMRESTETINQSLYQPPRCGLEHTHGTMARSSATTSILSEEFLYARTWTSEQQRSLALEVWNVHYNYHRHHTVAENRPPASKLHAGVTNVTASYS